MTILNSLINTRFITYNRFINVYKPKIRFLSECSNPKNRLSYLNWLSQSEKTNYFSKIDLKQCLDSNNNNTFSSFIDNYRNKVNELSYKISEIESYYRNNTDTSNELEYEVIGNYAYYLRPYGGSICLYRTDLSRFKNENKRLDLKLKMDQDLDLKSNLKLNLDLNSELNSRLKLSDYIIQNGQVLINFSDLAKKGIINVKKLRISPDGKMLSLMFDPELNDSCKVTFYSISNRTLLDNTIDDVGELYFMPYPKSKKFIRIYYTQLNNQKRSFKLYTSLIHQKSGKVCSRRLIYTEPNHFISLFKSKSGDVLFMATTSYNKIYSGFMINWNSKIYVIPTLEKTKIFMEYRNDSIYCIYSNLVSHIYKIPLYILKPYRSRISNKNNDNTTNSSNNILNDYRLFKMDYMVTDIDMLNNALVLYLLKPPSSPNVGLLRFNGYNKGHMEEVEYVGNVENTNSNSTNNSNDLHSLSNNTTISSNKDNYKISKENIENELHMVDISVKVGMIEPGINYDYNGRSVKFNINSPGMNRISYEVDLINNNISKIENMDSNIKSFVIEVPSRDGLCKIPVSVVAKGEVKGEEIQEISDIKDRKCMVYVYGFYGENLSVCNYMEHGPLLDMGYVLCFAHVRGGGELGEEWQKMGNKINKHNSFYDLIDVIQHIIAKNISTRNRIALSVSSASGIIGGCVYNMRPDLCSVIIFKLPYLDLLTTFIDPSQPLVELEYEEFGHRLEEKENQNKEQHKQKQQELKQEEKQELQQQQNKLLDHIYSMDPCSNVKNISLRNFGDVSSLKDINRLSNLNNNWSKLRVTKKPVLIINCDESDIRAPWYHTAKFVDLIKENEEKNKIFIKISNYGHDGSPPEDYLVETCSEEISIIDHYLNKTHT